MSESRINDAITKCYQTFINKLLTDTHKQQQQLPALTHLPAH